MSDDFSLEELAELGELESLFEGKRIGEILTALTTHSFNPHYAARVIHPELGEADKAGKWRTEIEEAAKETLRKRRVQTEEDLENVMWYLRDSHLSERQLKLAHQHKFRSTESFLQQVCKNCLDGDWLENEGKHHPLLSRGIRDYAKAYSLARSMQAEEPCEEGQLLVMNSYHHGRTTAKIYFVVQRVKRNASIEEKIAREIVLAEQARKRDMEKGRVLNPETGEMSWTERGTKEVSIKNPEDYLEDVCIKDYGGIAVVTHNLEAARAIQTAICKQSYLQVIKIKDFYNRDSIDDHNPYRANTYRAIHLTVNLPSQEHPDQIEIQLVPFFPEFLENGIGVETNRQRYKGAQHAFKSKGRRITNYNALVGEISQLLS